MLMLAQVNTFHNTHHQTLTERSTVHPVQVEHDDSLLRQIQVLQHHFKGQTTAEFL